MSGRRFTTAQAAAELGVTQHVVRRARYALQLVEEHLSEKELFQIKKWVAKAPPSALSVADAAEQWGVSEEAVRNALGEVAFLIADDIPQDKEKEIRNYALKHRHPKK